MGSFVSTVPHAPIRAVSPEPSLFANIKYGSRRRVRPKIGHLAPLDGWKMSLQRMKSAIISWDGSIYLFMYLFQTHNYTHVVSVLLSFLLTNFRIFGAPWAHIKDHKLIDFENLFIYFRWTSIHMSSQCFCVSFYQTLEISKLCHHKLID